MKMKKWAAAALALCLTLSLTACGSDAGAVYVQSVAELSGLGGIGKTELASRFGQSYTKGRVYLASFQNSFRDTVTHSIAKGIPNLLEKKLPEDEVYHTVMARLSQCLKDDILILDNVDQIIPEHGDQESMSLEQLKLDPIRFRYSTESVVEEEEAEVPVEEAAEVPEQEERRSQNRRRKRRPKTEQPKAPKEKKEPKEPKPQQPKEEAGEEAAKKNHRRRPNHRRRKPKAESKEEENAPHRKMRGIV